MSSRVWQALQSCLEPPQGSPWEPKPGDIPNARAWRSLSARSLELCTESLGCETGTLDFSSSDDDYEDQDRVGSNKTRSLSLSPRLCSARKPTSRSWSFNSRTISSDDEKGRNFPPPLTSISGEDSIQMSSRREGGRLVLKAVNVPSPHAYLQAERGEGRLTLRFIRRPSPHSKTEEARVSEKQAEDNNVVEDPVECNVVRNLGVKEEEEKKEAKTEEEEQALEEDADINKYSLLHSGCCFDDRPSFLSPENNGVNCEVGITDKLNRFTRCKEGRHGNQRFPWEPFWVATS